MVSSEGNAGEWWKTTIDLISKTSNFAWQHTFFGTFLCCCFAWLQLETSRNFLVARFMEEVSYVFLFLFFLLPLIFTMHWWPSHFATTATKFSCCSSNQKMPILFFVSRSRSLSPFFSLSFAGLLPTFSFSLSFSCFIFQICGHDN